MSLQQPDLTSIPEDLLCPISREMFVDPVSTITGQTYERAYIEKWFETHDTDPLTNKHVTGRLLIPNNAIKKVVEDFKKRVAVYVPQTSADKQTDRDREVAVSIWMEQQEQSHEIKNGRLNRIDQEIRDMKEKIAECIPENLREQLAALEKTNRAADKKKATELREKQLIEFSPPALQYYVTMQVSVNGVLNACSSISSGMVSNQRAGWAGSIAEAVDTFSSIADPIPFAKFGLSILTGLLNKWDERQQKQAVDRVVAIFRGDSTLSSLVAEGIARKMALYRKSALEDAEVKSHQKQQPKRGQLLGRVKETLRSAVDFCLNNGETDSSKVKATEDAQYILQEIMDGKLVVDAGFSSTTEEKAEVIATTIFTHTTKFKV